MKIRATRVLAIAALLLTGVLGICIRADIPASDLKARYSTPASRFMQLGGANLHYLDEGQGTPVILLHGTAASLNTWDGWASELSQRYRVLRLDLPGFGLTGPNTSRTYSIDYYTGLLQHFMDSLGIEQAHLAGSSLGGQIAYDFAATHPTRVNKLILIAPTGFTNANDKRITLPFRIARTPLLKHSLRYITPRFIVEKSLREVYGDDSRLYPETVRLSHELLLREGNRAAFIDRLNTTDADNLNKLGNIAAPTLILWGEADAWIPTTDARRFQEKIKGARLKVYPGAGHIPMEERAAETVQDALRFLKGAPAQQD